jgi:hypothetical protein
MSLLLARAGLLSQAAVQAPVSDVGTLVALDSARRPVGYTLSNANQTAINTSGGSNYSRWIPASRPILPTDGQRYWEVLCAPSGAASFDGYAGLISAAQRSDFNSGNLPILLGSISWRGNGSLWSSPTISAQQRITTLPPYGRGDVLMFVFDPALARIWIGKNGIWHSDPVTGAPVFTSSPSPAFYPFIHGRNSGDGGTLRSLPSQFAYPVPQGCRALGYIEPHLTIASAAAFWELGHDDPLSVAEVSLWLEQGSSSALTITEVSIFVERGTETGINISHFDTFIELDLT